MLTYYKGAERVGTLDPLEWAGQSLIEKDGYGIDLFCVINAANKLAEVLGEGSYIYDIETDTIAGASFHEQLTPTDLLLPYCNNSDYELDMVEQILGYVPDALIMEAYKDIQKLEYRDDVDLYVDELLASWLDTYMFRDRETCVEAFDDYYETHLRSEGASDTKVEKRFKAFYDAIDRVPDDRLFKAMKNVNNSPDRLKVAVSYINAWLTEAILAKGE
jgi:hypothetical protein